jgi:hypothetical protein
MKIKYSLVLLLAAVTCYSQSKDSVNNSLLKKKWALQFEVASNFSVRPFGGFAIALKYHLTDKSALRLALGLDYKDTKSERNALDYWFWNVRDYYEEEQISLDYFLYPSPRSDVIVFFGIGPSIGLSWQLQDIPHAGNNGELRFRTHKVTSRALRVDGIIGAEWFVIKNISLFAEYYASVYHEKTTISDRDWDNNNGRYVTAELTTSGIHFRGNSARLGLSLYFDFPF